MRRRSAAAACSVGDGANGANGANGGSVAKVLAYYAATVGQNGQALSERQVADMQATYASLTPIEQFAVREQIAKWDSDSPRPSEFVPFLANVARADPDPDKIGVAPARVPENSQRMAPAMVDTRSTVMNDMPRWEYRTEADRQRATERNIREGIR